MRPQRVLVFAAAILALVSLGGHFGTQVARASQTWNVLAGTDGDQIPGGGSLTANGFFPNVVAINAGDTVSWTFPSANPHGVAFDNGHLPPLDKQINPGPNPGEADISSLFLPINADQINGVFNPNVQFGSGVPQDPPGQGQPFTLTFNTAGAFFYDCQVHGTAMEAWVIVQPAGSTLSETPAQATARGQGELAAQLGGAAAGLSPQAPPIGGAPLRLAGGTSVVPATVGVEANSHVAALAFFPNSLTIHRGDTVVFTEADPSEIHTVTFLSGGPEPPLVDLREQPAGPPLVIFPANIVGPVGGNTYTGSGYFNSGILNPGESYSVTFDAPPGTYPFRCMVHGDAPQNMTGTLTIVP